MHASWQSFVTMNEMFLAIPDCHPSSASFINFVFILANDHKNRCMTPHMLFGSLRNNCRYRTCRNFYYRPHHNYLRKQQHIYSSNYHCTMNMFRHMIPDIQNCNPLALYLRLLVALEN